VPLGRFDTTYDPPASVTTVWRWPPASTTTLAPGIGAPLASTTRPLICPACAGGSGASLPAPPPIARPPASIVTLTGASTGIASSPASNMSPSNRSARNRSGTNSSHSTTLTGTSILGSVICISPFFRNGVPECR
jgi:hypothetical protein